MSIPILSLQNVAVARGDFVLCDGVSFVLHAGDICHLCGQNGLGKTTLLMQITGILPTLLGQIVYQGEGMLYVSHQTGIHESLSIVQNLTFLLSLYGIRPTLDDIDKALIAVGLAGMNDVKAGELSAGQSRRAGLARLWLMNKTHAPLWVLDEPLTALDIRMAHKLAERLCEFANSGGAVLITSHQTLNCATKHLDLADFAQTIDINKGASDE